MLLHVMVITIHELFIKPSFIWVTKGGMEDFEHDFKIKITVCMLLKSLKGLGISPTSGSGCSKLTTSLLNVSLKFQTLISKICQYFC